MVRNYERVLHALESGPDRFVPGNMYHIAPASNDTDPARVGKSWVWELPTCGGDRLMAGPFDSNHDGCEWVRKLLPPSASAGFGLTYTPPPPRVRQEQ